MRQAGKGFPVAIAVRGKVQALLVGAEPERPAKPVRLRGSAKQGKRLEGSRALYLRWLNGES